MRYKKGEIESIDKYFKFLDDKGADRLFFEGLMNQSDFEKMREHLDEYMESQQELPDIREDLNKYVSSLENQTKSVEEIIELFEKTEHTGFITDICKYLILSPQNKTNCILIHGAPNSGKTQFLQKLSEVFELVFYKQTRSHFDCKYKSNKKLPHFVICEEGCLGKLFDPRD